MATTTFYCNKDSRIAYRNSDGWEAGSGASDFLPVGLWTGYKYRTLLGFSYSFSGWTSLDSATIYLRTSTQFYVAFGSDPDIYIERITSSWSEGTADALSSSNAVTWANQPSATTSNRVTKDVSTVEVTEISADITALMQDAFAAGVFYGIRLRAIDETSEVETTEFYSRNNTTYRARIVVTYSTNTAPNAPTSLSPTGSAVVHTLTPTFTGSFSDPDAGDTMSGVEIQVVNDSETATMWSSGMLTASGTSFSVAYAGTALAGNTYYKWRARTKDQDGAIGAWSVYQRFKANSVPSSPGVSLQESPTSDIMTLTPTFQLTHSDPDTTDTQAYKYQIILETSGGAQIWDTGEVAITPATSISRTYNGPALNWQTSYRWKARTQDSNGAWGAYSTYQTFTTHTTAVPVSLAPTGNATASSTTPTLTGSRGDTNDTLVSAQVQVYADDGTTLIWDSGTFTAGVTSTSFSKVVGTVLTDSTYYRWRARVTGSAGGTSAFSALQRFFVPAATVPNQTAPLGPGITDTTPDFTFTRATSFDRHTLDLYSQDDNFVTPIWSDAPVAYAATTSKAVTSGVTLTYGKRYRWRVRVSADGGVNWSDYAGPSEFTMDKALPPVLTSPIDNAWLTTLTPTLQGNTQNAETISTFRIILYGEDQTTVIWDSGDLAGSGSSFSKVYDGPALTAGARYFWKATYAKTGGIPGDYSPLEDFHINIAPNGPVNRTPATGYVYADDASPIAPTFEAEFSDGDKATWGDFPTKFEVEVARNSDGVVMYTLERTAALSGGTNAMTDGDVNVTKVIGPGGANLTTNVEYRWRTRYTDSKSAVGMWSASNVFKPSQAPSVTVTAPGATVTSPSFTASWSFSSPLGKLQTAYRVRVVRNADGVQLYDTGKVFSSATTTEVPAGYLQNGVTYGVYVRVWDTDDLVSGEAVQLTTASWTAPDAPSDFSAVDDPTTSSVLLTWTASNLPPQEFSLYQIYRREQSDASWTAYATVTSQSVTLYRDYFAAHGILYDYAISVFKLVPGDVDLESPLSSVASSILDPDAWWVVGADRADDHIFELPVFRAPFREPIQQEVFEPLGSRRKTVIRGRVLGAEGTLELTWKDGEVRDARRRMAYIRDARGPHILKSPFGDVWLVEFSGPDKDYLPAGHLGSKLAWTEVDE